MEDIRIGRRKRSRVTLVPIGATADAVIAPKDPDRTHIVITETTGVAVFVSDKQMTAANQGLRVLATGSQNPEFDVELHGDFVQNEIHAFNPTAGALVVAVLETSLGER